MLNKSKLNLSVILLVLGLGFIPTGVFINGYITDEVSANVSVMLRAIEEEAVSEIEQSYLGLGIPEVIPAIFDYIIPEIQTEIVYPIGIPKTLLYIKNKTLEMLPTFINASGAANAINDAINFVVENHSKTEAYARNAFFNDVNFKNNFSVNIKGVSEAMNSGTIDLLFSSTTMVRLLEGYRYNETDYPGLLTDLELGYGVLNWLNFYSLAEANIGNRTLIEQVYQCSWDSYQLQNLSAYIKSYLWDVVVKNVYTSQLKTLEEYALDVFYSQWANGSLISSGIGLRQISDEVYQRVYGLEVGRYVPSNITTASAIDLWNPMNPLSFVNTTGIRKWFNASAGDNSTIEELQTYFELSNSSYDVLVYWITETVKNDLVPYIFSLPLPIGFGETPFVYTMNLLLDQWANGTTFGESINLGYGITGFEVGIPDKTNITITSALNLFNASNVLSFINSDGILNWIDAFQGDTSTQNEILTTFNLTLEQYNTVSNWLFDTMRYYIIPHLARNLTEYTMEMYAKFEFYPQWSRGRIFNNGLTLGSILGLDSVSEWEIGIPTDIDISDSLSETLWDEKEDLSLTNFKGSSLWLKAMKETGTYNHLKNNFGLSDTEMDRILEWLVKIRENYVLPSLQNEANLPVNYYTLGDNMFLGFLIAGGVLTGIGIVGVVLQVILKRK